MKPFTIWTARYQLHPLCVFNSMYYNRTWTFNNPCYQFTSVMYGNRELAFFDSLGTVSIDKQRIPYDVEQRTGNKT
jgi:hypothetical protein